MPSIINYRGKAIHVMYQKQNENDQPVFGLCIPSERLIYIDPSMHKSFEALNRTLIHEFVHLIIADTGQCEHLNEIHENAEESLVQAFEHALEDFIVWNKTNVVKWEKVVLGG